MFRREDVVAGENRGHGLFVLQTMMVEFPLKVYRLVGCFLKVMDVEKGGR